MRSIFGAVRFLLHPRRPAVVNLSVLFLCLGSLLLAQESEPATQKFVISGAVKSGTTPIPGATVTATDSAGQKTITSTDLDGTYMLQVPAPGHYTVRAEMSAFAPITRDVVVAGTSTQAALGLVLLSRWLFRRGRKEAAYAALLRSRSSEQADLELREMEQAAASENASTSGGT